MALMRDWRDFIGLLNSESVRYLLIGGWAYNRYAEPRFTGDIDFFVAPEPENQAALRRALDAFGFGSVLPPEPAPVISGTQVLMLGRPPHRIDLLATISGVEFERAWEAREGGTLDEMPVFFISREHLLQNKRAAGRAKDLLDASVLEKLIARDERSGDV